jgi:hypothetical protein
VTAGAIVTQPAAIRADQPPASVGQTPSADHGSAAPAATSGPRSTGSVSSRPGPAVDHRGDQSGVHLLVRYAARSSSRRHARHSRRSEAGSAGGASPRARVRHLADIGHLSANPLVSNVAAAGTNGGRAPASSRARVGRMSPGASLFARTRVHGVRRGDGSSVASAPPQPDAAPQDPGGRPTRGVGLAASGGTGAPTTLMVRLGFAPVPASWLAAVTGEAFHLQFPVTHRLERPG